MNTSTSTRQAQVRRLIPAHRAVEGEGFVVRRPFPTAELSYLDPFMLFDHMGPIEFSPGAGMGTPWHPHRGFQTVTYLLEGEAEHRDSLGSHGFLGAGDTQWMTAGSGVFHKEGPSEAAQRAGGRMHGLQLWVNLPAAKKMIEPAYQDIGSERVASRTEGTTTIRVIAGTLFGLTGPGSTHTPISYAHVTLAPGDSVSTDLPADHLVLAYPMVGSFEISDIEVTEATLAVVEGTRLTIRAHGESAEVIVLTGEPIGEPVARYGPFVMNTQTEIRQAYADFESGRFGAPSR